MSYYIVLGAFVGGAIGGIGAALISGDLKDVLVGVGAGVAGGAFTTVRWNPLFGAMVAGFFVGSWAGGRIGYNALGAVGAVVGAICGGPSGVGIGFLGGMILVYLHFVIYLLTQTISSSG